MNEAVPWYEEIVIPALLRFGRNTYGGAMRRALEAAGYDDIPRNGLFILGGMAMGADGVPLGHLVKDLGVSKQGVGQLVDTLVLRGYLERTTDPDDRRKLTVKLTERGRAAAAIQAAAREKIDQALLARVGAENILRTRKTLAALIAIGKEQPSESVGAE